MDGRPMEGRRPQAWSPRMRGQGDRGQRPWLPPMRRQGPGMPGMNRPWMGRQDQGAPWMERREEVRDEVRERIRDRVLDRIRDGRGDGPAPQGQRDEPRGREVMLFRAGDDGLPMQRVRARILERREEAQAERGDRDG